MQYRYFLDGLQVHEPGIDGTHPNITLFRDEEQRILATRVDGSLMWGALRGQALGDAYDYLLVQFDDSYCNRVAIQIDQKMGTSHPWDTIFEGFIFMTDLIFDKEKRVVEASITDNTFAAQIDHNRGIKFNLDGLETKNGAINDNVPANQNINFFKPANAVASYVITNVESYLFSDMLDFLVKGMTDNNMSVSVPIFEAGGDFENIIICTGAAIRAAAGGIDAVTSAPYISYDDAWQTAWKQFNLWMRPDDTTLILEKASDQYQADVILDIDDVMNIEVSCEQDRLYSEVKMGSSSTQGAEGGTFAWPDLRFYTHAQETYHTTGFCGHVEETLDLETTFITDSNIIQDIIDNDNDAYDTDVFLVETNGALANKYDDFSAPPFVYNRLLVNSAVAKRWEDFIPNTIAWYLGSPDDNIVIDLTAGSTSFGSQTPPFSFVANWDDVISDPAGNWNAGQDNYVAPTNGWYEFNVDQDLRDIKENSFGGFPFDFTVRFEHLETGGATIENKDRVFTFTGFDALFKISVSEGFYMDATDRCRITYIGTDNGPGAPPNVDIDVGTFRTIAIVNGGGIFLDGILKNVINWKFNRKLSHAEFLDLIGSPGQRINVNGTDTFIRSVRWNSYTQMADFVLLEDIT